MTFAPRFLPDGDSVIMSMAESGNTEIYTMDLSTRKVLQLTRHSAIDTRLPIFHQTAKEWSSILIAAELNNSHVMNANGSSVKRASVLEKDGMRRQYGRHGETLIAFTKFTEGGSILASWG